MTAPPPKTSQDVLERRPQTHRTAVCTPTGVVTPVTQNKASKPPHGSARSPGSARVRLEIKTLVIKPRPRDRGVAALWWCWSQQAEIFAASSASPDASRGARRASRREGASSISRARGRWCMECAEWRRGRSWGQECRIRGPPLIRRGSASLQKTL